MEDRSFLSILTCAHREHFWAPSTSPQNWGHLSWWGQSKWPHSNLGRCRCVLFGTGSHTAIPSAQCRPPWPADLCPQNEDSGSQSHRGTRFLCLQFSWCYGNLSSVTSVTKTVIYYEAFYFPQIEGYCEIPTPLSKCNWTFLILRTVELLPIWIMFIGRIIDRIWISAVVLSTELFQP